MDDQKTPREAKRTFGAVLLTLWLDLAGFSLLFPLYEDVLAGYVQVEGGWLAAVSSWAVSIGIVDQGRQLAFVGGFLSALYALVQFAIAPLWGRRSDRIGRRPVLLLTLGLHALSYALWAVSGSFEVFLLARILGAFASGNIGVASAVIADISERKDRAKAMGLLGAAIGFGFLTGPALGALSVSLPRLGEWGEGSLAFHPHSAAALLALALATFNWFWVWRVVPETRPPEGPDAPRPSANPLRLFREDLGVGVARLGLVQLLFTVAFSGFETTIVFVCAEPESFGWSPGQIGLALVWTGLFSIGTQGGLVRRLAPRVGERPLALLGIATMIPASLLIVIAAELTKASALLLGLGAFGVGIGLCAPCLSALVSLAARNDVQGIALGSFRSLGALGRAIGPLVAATLYFQAGPAAPYYGVAVIVILPLVLLATAKLPGSARDE